MLYEHTTDIGSSRGAAARYLIASATKSSLQTTLQALEKIAGQSVELYRFVVSAAVSSIWTPPQTEEKNLLVSKLVSTALEKSNALTLVSAAVDESPVTVTKESLVTLMTRDLKLTPPQQLQFAMGLLAGSKKGKEAAAEFLNGISVAQYTVKEDVASLWSYSVLARQLGDVQALETQLSAAAAGAAGGANDRVTVLPHDGVVDMHVSLSRIIDELGTACVATPADCRELLSLFPRPVTQVDVADVVGFFASQGSAPTDTNTYNALMASAGREPTKVQQNAAISPFPLLELLQERVQEPVDWDTVLRMLDKSNEGPFVRKHVSIVFDAYCKFKGTGTPGVYPPITIFLGRWSNVGRQRTVLEYILKHPEKVSMQGLSCDQMAPIELVEVDAADAASSPTTSGASASPSTVPESRAGEVELWRYFPFLEAAVHVASRDGAFDAETLRPAALRYPLLMLYSLLFGSFPGTMKNFSTAKLILRDSRLPLERVATTIIPEAERRGKLNTVISLLSELTIVVPSRTIDVMEAVLKTKNAVRAFLAVGGNPRLVTAIAMCMDESNEGGGGGANCGVSGGAGDSWISKALEGKLHFRAHAAENRFAVATSIVEVAEQLLDKQKYVPKATAALNTFLASSLKDLLRDVAEQARILLASTDSLFPTDVENDATEFYRRMYKAGDPTISASLAFIEQLLKSSKSRDKQLCACIVSIMFEECNAIGCYPHKELQLFATLYGQMIARELLPPNQQQRAWTLLLPVIVKPTDHLVEEYGIIALEQIKPRLAEWPQYGRALRHVKDLDIRIPGIMAAINRGIKAEEAARQSQSRAQNQEKTTQQQKEVESLLSDPAVLALSTERRDNMLAAEQQKDRVAAATLHQHDIGTLLSKKNITAPPRVIQEQINFIIGNTDLHNVENNARELAKQLRPEYYEFFAEYFVVKRAALEPNYHPTYLNLLNNLQSKQLEKAIRSATVSSIKLLLSSDKIRADPGERSLLKNLGYWLGLLTLAKNIPITAQELCFKDLIILGLREGKLMAVVSCIARVLHHCMDSRFFCPPNPWTMRQLCLLWEMYNLRNLRVTLRFEVDLLCKHMNVKLEEIEQYYNMHPIHSSTQLCISDVYREINIHQSADFRVDKMELQDVVQQPHKQVQQPQQAAQPQLQTQAARANRPLQANAEPFKPKDSMVPSGGALAFEAVGPRRPPIVITPETVRVSEEEASLFGERLAVYKGYLAKTLERVTQELKPTVQRSGTIAAVTACHITTKDFLFDRDIKAQLRAADAMARSLASNLCTVAIRDALPEPFNVQVGDLISRLIDVNVPSYTERRERLKGLIRENNMDLCVRALEWQAAEEGAKRLHEKLDKIIKEKIDQITAREPPRAPKEYHDVRDLLMHMGEVLRPPHNLPPLQRAVYEEFNNSVPVVGLLTAYVRTLEDATVQHYSTGDAKVLSLTSPEFANGHFGESHDVIRTRVIGISNIINAETAIYCVGPMLRKLFVLAGAMKRADSGTAASNDLTTARHRNVCNLLNEVYLFVLQTCYERGGDIIREELTQLYLQAEQRWSYTDLAVNLLRIKVLNVSRFDAALSKALLAEGMGRQGVVDFAGATLSRVIVNEKLLSAKELRDTVSQLESIASKQDNQTPRQQQNQPKQQRHQPQSQQLPASGQDSGAMGGAQMAPGGAAPTNAMRASPALSNLVEQHVRRLVVPTLAPQNQEDAEKIRGLFEEWLIVNARRMHSSSSESNQASGAATNAPSQEGATAPTTSSPASATAAPTSTTSAALPGNKPPPQYEYMMKLRDNKQLDGPQLRTFLTTSLRFCVEHYATKSLELERSNPAVLGRALTAEWKPGNAPPHRYQYDDGLFTHVDALSDLVTVLLYYCSLKNESRTLLTLLRRVLDAFQWALIDNHQAVVVRLQQAQNPNHLGNAKSELPAGTAYAPMFQQQPYVRFFSNLFTTLVRADSPKRETMEQITSAFADTLHNLPPLKYPAFTFGWLELVSHRIFLNRCLRSPVPWPSYVALLVQGLEFIERFTREGNISKNVLVFYKAFFKLMLVLTHDYSRFLITYHYQLCDAIPPYCVQLLNTVLCSFPSGVKLPEFFARVPDDGSEMRKHPATDNQVKCIEESFKQHHFDGNALSEKLQDDRPMSESYMQSIVEKLQSLHNWRLMNAIVLHVCIVYLQVNDHAVKPNFPESNAMRFYRHLAGSLDHEHRYYFICSCANHLRYPNCQTNFFVKVISNLFLPHRSIRNAVVQQCIQEQITRVAVEKTLIIQPHPWGVLSTFMELMRAPEYGFWEKSFICSTSFLESMFTKLRRSVESRNAQQQVQQSTGSASTSATQGKK
ncbi:NOT1 [Trypanosoma brucei brucei TREU927]|uniref:NOT1 n=1 Tax=Trypanosoma brucei brucei (strain 927/4 GUTat10.1) TaxID=185431 RepID=Q38C90_TRYB2|nr:transcriptional regulatory protein NOT1 [Trypanosoma brucei brucei TREU927]EAN77580.1 NOT1 [Trypanosoma brucei brucei TREU927]